MAAVLIGVAFAVAYAALLLNRRTREMMARRKTPLRIAGVVLLVLAFLILVPGLSMLPRSVWPVAVNAMPFMVLIALALIMVPGAAEQMPANEAQAKAAMEAVRAVQFSGLREAGAAIPAPFREARDAGKAAAVWVLLGWGWMLGSYGLIRGIETTGQGALGPAVLSLIGFAVVVSLGFSAVAVAWHRRVLEGAPVPWFKVDGAVFGYFWRLWVAALVFGAFDRLVSGWAPGIAGALNLPEPTVAQGLPWLIGVAALLVFANFSLMLPARAVGEKVSPFSVAANLLPWLSAGLVLTLLPYAAAIWLSNQVRLDGPLAHLQVLLNLVLMFAAVIAAVAYLSRAYAAARTALAS